MRRLHRFAVSFAIAALALSLPATASDPTTDFDFWQGEWKVTVQAALPDGSWRSADGEVSARKLAGGNAHMESIDTGLYKSSGIRAFNVATGQWDYTMFDNLQMKGLQVWSGTFEDGVGTFSAALTLPTGAKADTRIIIDEIEATGFRWRFEMKVGETPWRTAMKMAFRRAE